MMKMRCAILRNGAKGYLLKGTSSAELVTAVRVVNKGQSYVSPSFAAQLILSRGHGESVGAAATKRFPELSEKEEQILMLVFQGWSNRRIGDKLGPTEKTVKGYVTSVMEKLHVLNRVEAAMIGAERISGKRSSAK